MFDQKFTQRFSAAFFEDTVQVTVPEWGDAVVTCRVVTDEDREKWRSEFAFVDDRPNADGRRKILRDTVLGWSGFHTTEGNEIPFTDVARDRIAADVLAFSILVGRLSATLSEFEAIAEKN